MKKFYLEKKGKRDTKHLDGKLDGESQAIDLDWDSPRWCTLGVNIQ